MDVLDFLDSAFVRSHQIESVIAVGKQGTWARDTLLIAQFDAAGQLEHLVYWDSTGQQLLERKTYSPEGALVTHQKLVAGLDSTILTYQYPLKGSDWISQKKEVFKRQNSQAPYQQILDEERIRKYIEGRLLQEMYFVFGQAQEVTYYQYWAGFMLRKSISAIQEEGPPKLIYEKTYDYDLEERPLQTKEIWTEEEREQTVDYRYPSTYHHIKEIKNRPSIQGVTEMEIVYSWGQDSLLITRSEINSKDTIILKNSSIYLDSLGRKYLEITQKEGRWYRSHYNQWAFECQREEQNAQGKWVDLEIPPCPNFTFEKGLPTKKTWIQNQQPVVVLSYYYTFREPNLGIDNK